MKKTYLILALLVIASAGRLFAQADMKETIAMIKTNLTESKAKMKNYEWIETTTTFLKGEEKSKQQNQCYYSLDGKLTKVATGGTTQAKEKGGIRGKVIANKKEEMGDYVAKAIAKVQTYLPPDGGKIQQIYDGGKVGIQILEPGKKFKLDFPDYLEKGDILSITVDKVNKKLVALAITTSVDNPSEKVIFNVKYSDLPDGTQYAGETSLDAQAKNLKIVIVNSGFKKASGK